MARRSERGAAAAAPEAGRGLWVVPLLAILNLLLYFMISMGLVTDFGVSIFWWKAGSIVFQLILCAVLIKVLIASYSSDRTAVAGEDEGEIEAASRPGTRPRAPAPARAAPAAPRSTTTPRTELLAYPEKVSGGVYATTLVRVDDRRVLKLRTLLARACLLCDEQGECWSTVRSNLNFEDFRSNVDCKEGLKSFKAKNSGM